MSWREFPIISCIKWAQLNCYMKNEALCVFDNDTDLQLSDDLVWFGEEWIVNVMEKKVSPWLFHFRALVFLWGYSGSSLSDIGFDFRIFVLSEVKIQKYVQGSPSMRLFFPLCQTLVFSFPWRLDWLPLHPSSQLVFLGRSNRQGCGSSKCGLGPQWFSDRRGYQSESCWCSSACSSSTAARCQQPPDKLSPEVTQYTEPLGWWRQCRV